MLTSLKRSIFSTNLSFDLLVYIPKTTSSKSPHTCLTGTLTQDIPTQIHDLPSPNLLPTLMFPTTHSDAQAKTSPGCSTNHSHTLNVQLLTSPFQPPLIIPTVITLGQATTTSTSIMSPLPHPLMPLSAIISNLQ